MSSFRGSLIILMIAVRLSAGVGPAERRRGQRPDERRGANRRCRQRANEGRKAEFRLSGRERFQRLN